MRRAGAIAVALCMAAVAHGARFGKFQTRDAAPPPIAVLKLFPNLPTSTELATGAAISTSRGAVTVTRSGTNRFCDSRDGGGVTLAANTPCVDIHGLHQDGVGTNRSRQSEAFDNATWTVDGGTITANTTDVLDPKGGNTAEKFVMGAVSASTDHALVSEAVTTSATAGNNSVAVWARTASGTASIWLGLTDFTTYYGERCELTTTWQRCVANQLPGSGMTTLFIGADRRWGVTPVLGAQTVYLWGAGYYQATYSQAYAVTTIGNAATGNETISFANPLATANTKYCIRATVYPDEGWRNYGNTRVILAAPSGSIDVANSIAIKWGLTSIYFQVYDAAGNFKKIEAAITDTNNASLGGFPSWKHEHVIGACNNNGALTLYRDGVLLTTTATTGTGNGNVGTMPTTWEVGDPSQTGALSVRDVCIDKIGPAGPCKVSTPTTNTSLIDGVKYAGGATKISALGDSITYGYLYAQPPYPIRLQNLLGTSYTVTDNGIGGNTVAQCKANYEANVKGQGYSTVVVLCGVNDMINSSTAASTWTTLQALFDEIRADGASLVPVTLSPWSTSSLSTAGKQTETTSLNTSIRNYATTNSLALVDAYVFLADGVDPTKLNAAYDSGDHLHINQYGHNLLADRVMDALTP